MKKSLRINGHSHVLPNPEQIPAFMKEAEIFWIDENRTFMYQKDWQRPITDSSFFLKEKLEWMESNRVDHAVVITLSQLYGNGLAPKEMKAALRFQNDFNANIQKEYPSKFTSGFVVQPSSIDGALKEIDRCVNELGLGLLCLPTHFQESDGSWKCVFEEEYQPILELANKYNLAIEIHPYDGEKLVKLKNTGWRFHLVWMLAQCADAYHFYTLNTFPEKFPNIRVCFAHGAQLAQINLGRRIQGFDGRPDLFEGKTHPRKFVGHQNIYFDSLVHDTDSLKLLIERQSSQQIILGLDDPYPLGEMNNERQSSYPGKILDLALEREIITETEFEEIWEKNIITWLVGNSEDQIENLKNRIRGNS